MKKWFKNWLDEWGGIFSLMLACLVITLFFKCLAWLW